MWVLNQRCHHGAVGLGLVGFGLLLMLHDSKDWRLWFKRARLFIDAEQGSKRQEGIRE